MFGFDSSEKNNRNPKVPVMPEISQGNPYAPSDNAIPDEFLNDPEGREAYESLMRHRAARKRKKLIHLGIAGGIALTILTIIAFTVLQPKQKLEAPLGTAFVERTNFTEAVSATGTVQPVSSYVVTPEVDGIIQDVSVAEGSSIKKGDFLFNLKNDALDKAVRDAQQQLRTAQADLERAKANLSAAQLAPTPTVDDIQEGTQNNLGGPGSTSDAESSVQAAQAAVDTAQNAYNDAVATAAKRKVVAPADGNIIVMNAVNGAGIGAESGKGGLNPNTNNSSLITIADLSKMTVTIQVNEVDISKIQVGQKARASFSALPEVSCEAQVTRIATVSNGSNEGVTASFTEGAIVTYSVTLLIDKPDAQLKPGMSTTVDILLQDIPDVLCVPSQAIMTDEAGTYINSVTFDNNNKPSFKRVEVKVVAQSSTTAVVEGSEVSEGMQIQISGDPNGVGNEAGFDSGMDGSGMFADDEQYDAGADTNAPVSVGAKK
ncbi:efflux RND transporter periplasmic adaptor subunit [Atopobium fossor]|uniref:efflux RND transporter periplasmic adaptor subunit n=1 Tax=Atopobium fossor TaxID=39487 RepID=UPI0003FCC0FB|nr:efflux RND transporter periplasmic adaptor subunit [Atopobium fossor]